MNSVQIVKFLYASVCFKLKLYVMMTLNWNVLSRSLEEVARFVVVVVVAV